LAPPLVCARSNAERASAGHTVMPLQRCYRPGHAGFVLEIAANCGYSREAPPLGS
jgi:hypothetical protein